MTGTPIRNSRRRFLTLIGAAASVPLVTAWPFRSAAAPIFSWRGQTLGAETNIFLAGLENAAARKAVADCLTEIDRLEAIFSLYRQESELSRLNRDGVLSPASPDLRLVLGDAIRMSQLSNGAFDVTVQPLWRLYADQRGAMPDPAVVASVLETVNYRRLTIDRSTVRFHKPGMAITLNGIAQGYITDRVTELLRQAGTAHVMVQLGETRALGPPPDENGWPLTLPGGRPMTIVDEAVATSSPQALTLGDTGQHSHILDPRTGATPVLYDAVSVFAPLATTADALSTTLSLLPETVAAPLLRQTGARKAVYRKTDGEEKVVIA